MKGPRPVRGARLEKLTAWHMPHTQSSGAPPPRPASPAPAVGCGAMLYSNFRISPCSARSWRPGASISARASSTLAKSCTQQCTFFIQSAVYKLSCLQIYASTYIPSCKSTLEWKAFANGEAAKITCTARHTAKKTSRQQLFWSVAVFYDVGR